MSDHDAPLEKVYSFTRTALPLMSQYGIPTTPLNYSVWYHYVAGENEQLNSIIDTMLKNEEPFTKEKTRDLYSKFCSVYNESKTKILQEGLTQLIVTLFTEIRGLTGQTEKYESFLTRSVAELTEEGSYMDLSQTIQSLIDETKSVIQHSKNMQVKFKETSRSLLALQKEYEKAKNEAIHDPLTGVFNRKAFIEKAEQAMKQSDENKKKLSMILVDIDNFKSINDTHGHLAGDEVLKFVACQINNMVKGQDVVTRFGGEEFTILLPNTSFEGALHVAEQIRGYFDRNELQFNDVGTKLGKVTLSIGIAVYAKGDSLNDFVQRADKAMYMAKERGRNRVITERHLTM